MDLAKASTKPSAKLWWLLPAAALVYSGYQARVGYLLEQSLVAGHATDHPWLQVDAGYRNRVWFGALDYHIQMQASALQGLLPSDWAPLSTLNFHGQLPVVHGPLLAPGQGQGLAATRGQGELQWAGQSWPVLVAAKLDFDRQLSWQFVIEDMVIQGPSWCPACQVSFGRVQLQLQHDLNGDRASWQWQ